VESSSDPAQATSAVFAAILTAENRLRASFEKDVGAELELGDRAGALLTTAMSDLDHKIKARVNQNKQEEEAVSIARVDSAD
jgi:hypothetical protein